MAQFNKDPQKEFNKIYNGEVPASMQNGGSGLDIGCGDIETASAGMDDDPTEFTEGNGPVGEAIGAAMYLPSEMARQGKEAVSALAGSGAMMESDKKRAGKDTEGKFRSRKEVFNTNAGSGSGAPPPLMSAEGNAEAEYLGESVSGRRAMGTPVTRKSSSSKRVPTGSDPAHVNRGPQNAYSLELTHPLQQHNPLMSEAADKMSRKSAPNGYKDTKIGTSGVDRMMRGGK
jgi:hypothetical protein